MIARERDESNKNHLLSCDDLKNEYIYYLLNDFGGDTNDKNCVSEIQYTSHLRSPFLFFEKN